MPVKSPLTFSIAIPTHLRRLTSLRVLRVKWLLNGTSEDRNKTSARALASTGHPRLQTLILHVDTRLSTNPLEELAILGGELDDALATGSKFPALQAMALHLEVEPDELPAPRWWDDALPTAFPLTYGAGIMRLCGTSQFEREYLQLTRCTWLLEHMLTVISCMSCSLLVVGDLYSSNQRVVSLSLSLSDQWLGEYVNALILVTFSYEQVPSGSSNQVFVQMV